MITGEKAWTDLTVVIAYHTIISFTAATGRLLWQGASYKACISMVVPFPEDGAGSWFSGAEFIS